MDSIRQAVKDDPSSSEMANRVRQSYGDAVEVAHELMKYPPHITANVLALFANNDDIEHVNRLTNVLTDEFIKMRDIQGTS